MTPFDSSQTVEVGLTCDSELGYNPGNYFDDPRKYVCEGTANLAPDCGYVTARLKSCLSSAGEDSGSAGVLSRPQRHAVQVRGTLPAAGPRGAHEKSGGRPQAHEGSLASHVRRSVRRLGCLVCR